MVFVREKEIEVREPASCLENEKGYIGTANGLQKVVLPDISSCLAIIIETVGGIKVCGHVPMIWGAKSDFALFDNAKKIFKDMMEEIRTPIQRILFIGDMCNWNSDSSYLDSNVVDRLMRENGDEIPYQCYDKSTFELIHVHVSRNFIKIHDQKTGQTSCIAGDYLAPHSISSKIVNTANL